MDSANISIFVVVIQILMAIISLIGGAMLMQMQNTIKELKEADKDLANNLKEYTRAEDVKEWRKEQREELALLRSEQNQLFNQLFAKVDDLREKVANKADR